MRKASIFAVAASVIVTPAQASDPSMDLGPGAFIGARAKLSFGGHSAAKPQAGLAIAPTRSSVSSEGMVRTKIGEGVALNLVGPKPTLTLAGVRADQALGLRSQGKVAPESKLGLSTVGWIAIGAGVIGVAVGGLYLWAEHVSYCEEEDHNCG